MPEHELNECYNTLKNINNNIKNSKELQGPKKINKVHP